MLKWPGTNVRKYSVAALVMLLVCGIVACAESQVEAEGRIEPPALDAELRAELESWLVENGKGPVDYVVGLFADHDVVILGEQHRVKHDVLLVGSLLEALYRTGVRTLATEFGRREDQPLIDSLVNAPRWDEALARNIVFNQFVTWGYREYVDVYRAAWQVNRSLAPDAPPFLVLALDDSPDWSHIQKPEDRNDPEVMRKVWRGGGERYWAEVVLDAVESGEKVLVHCGIHHAFTEYRQPIVVEGEFVRYVTTRAGNYVYREIGKRAVTVYLHAPWDGPGGYGDALVHPADGVIDALMLEREGGPRPVGFDLHGSPFGKLRIENAVYKHGYEFRLAEFADGWIYTRPISEYEGVTPIPNWINERNIVQARPQIPNPDFRDATIERFNAAIARDADIPRRWGHLR
ncbi:MAG: hypothetical protein V3U13_08715 [Gemmatimonadota bacterium]